MPVTAAFLLLAACSGGGSDDGSAPQDGAGSSDDLTVIQPGRPGEEASTGSPGTPISEDPSQADIEFMQMMVPHHAQAVEMSELAAKHAADPAVRQLAARIRAAQGPEILSMSAWLEQRGLAVPEAGHDHGSMPGMLTEAQMTALSEARGARFDRLFLQGMIQHHRGALAMAETVATDGVDVVVGELAADVHLTQTSEIATMQELLADL